MQMERLQPSVRGAELLGHIDILAEHQYVTKIIEATEEEQGYTLHKCILCGQSYKDNFTDYEEPVTEPITEEITEMEKDTTETVPIAAGEENKATKADGTKIGKVKIKSAKNVKTKSIKIKLSKVKNAKSYKIQYSTNSKFKKATIKNTKKLTYTIKKLRVGKKYYIRVKAVNEKLSGKWSSIKKVKIKK